MHIIWLGIDAKYFSRIHFLEVRLTVHYVELIRFWENVVGKQCIANACSPVKNRTFNILICQFMKLDMVNYQFIALSYFGEFDNIIAWLNEIIIENGSESLLFW